MTAIRLAFARYLHVLKIMLIAVGLVIAIGVVCATGMFVAVIMGVVHAFQSCH